VRAAEASTAMSVAGLQCQCPACAPLFR
jgi:hypothetical protein